MANKTVIGGSVLGVILGTVTLVKPWEGVSLTPYKDVVGVATVCYGATNGIENRKYTQAECEQLLASDIGDHFIGLTRCIKQPLREREWVALASWTYNVGVGAACGSTLVKRINAGEKGPAWCAELDKWTYAKGKYVKGLANRRAAERAVCEGKA